MTVLTHVDSAVHYLGYLTVVIVVWRSLLSFYRRVIMKPKKPLEYGKWAIVTGSTSGIGEEFAEYLAQKGMSILLISRTESKLAAQAAHISSTYKVGVRYLAFDFSCTGQEKTSFYSDALVMELQVLNGDGGVGLLVNNVGTANEHPTALDEFADKDIDDMINCNIGSLVGMTRAVLGGMKQRKSGCVISVSSGSGNWCSPYLVVYSSTKAFMTQFTRSMHVECWGTGVDFYVACPFYVRTKLCKAKPSRALNSPIKPILLIEGIMSQLGKKYVWQGNGYWLHGLLQNAGLYSWRTVTNNLRRCVANRERYRKKMAGKKDE